jgi:cell division protein FtsB
MQKAISKLEAELEEASRTIKDLEAKINTLRYVHPVTSLGRNR